MLRSKDEDVTLEEALKNAAFAARAQELARTWQASIPVCQEHGCGKLTGDPDRVICEECFARRGYKTAAQRIEETAAKVKTPAAEAAGARIEEVRHRPATITTEPTETTGVFQALSSRKSAAVRFILENHLNYVEASIVRAVVDWRDVGGVSSLRRARDLLNTLIEYESKG